MATYSISSTYVPSRFAFSQRLRALQAVQQGQSGRWSDPVNEPAYWQSVLVGSYSAASDLGQPLFVTGADEIPPVLAGEPSL
jgi:hypothetical protein